MFIYNVCNDNYEAMNLRESKGVCRKQERKGEMMLLYFKFRKESLFHRAPGIS